jgi:beta-lactamase regulating signal transducer with metallopeptidase domain
MSTLTLNQAADVWMNWVTGVIFQASVVALIALATVRWSRNLPANVKYVFLLLAMVKFFTPPFAALPFGIFSHITSPTFLSEADTSDYIQSSVSPVTRVDARISDAGPGKYSQTIQAASVVLPEAHESSTPAQETTAATANVIQPPSTAAATNPRLPQLSTNAWLMLCGLLGAVVLIFRIARGFFCLRRIVSSCNPATEEIHCNFLAVAESMGVIRARLLLSPEPLTPMACGLFRPAVVVPRSLVEQFTPDEQRAIFAHELAHHRRFDPLVLWIQWGFVAIWWFHPLAWTLNRTILRLREQCCDDLVIIEKQATREQYGAALLRAVEWCAARTRILDYAAPQMYSLKDRIVGLIDPRTRRAARLSLWNWVTVVLIGLVILPGFGRLAPEAVATPQAQTFDDRAKPDSTTDETLCVVGGRVLNGKGLPIKATVWLRTHQGRFQSCDTDDDGRYQFMNVEPGWTTVAALGDGYSHTGVGFTLQEGRNEKNLNLVATAPKSLNLNIRNEQGEPVAGVELWSIQWKTASRKWFGLYPKLMEAEQIEVPRSDASGLLSFPRLPADAICTVYLRHPDYVGEMLENLPIDQSFNVTLKDGYPIVVTAINAETSEPITDATVSISGSPRGIKVTDAKVADDGTYRTRLPVQTQHLKITVRHPDLSTGGEVKREYRDGLVHYDARLYRRGIVRGRVIDESTGQPVSGLRVDLTKQGKDIGQAVSGVDGTFEIPVPAGSYFRVSIQGGEGFYSGVYKEPLQGDLEQQHQVLVPAPPRDVKVMPDETVVLADLTVNRLPKVKGVVLMPDGHPAAGALVIDDSWPPGTYRTDANGRFEFEGNQPNMIHLKAYHLTQPLVADAGVTLREIFAGTELELRLQPAADARGKVMDQNELAVVGVEVSLIGEVSFGPPGKVGTMRIFSKAASSMTDENGDFRFSGLSRDLSYSAVVGAPFEKTSTRSNWLQPPLTATEFEPIRLPAALPTAGTQTIPRIAPSVQCRDWLNSPAITNEATHGKVVVLHFCDTLNTKSVDQLVATQEIHDLYKDKGCVVIAVFHSSVSVSALEVIAREHHISCPLAIDNPTGETFNSFDVTYVPHFVLIGRDGRIISDQVANYDLLPRVRQAVMDSNSEE